MALVCLLHTSALAWAQAPAAPAPSAQAPAGVPGAARVAPATANPANAPAAGEGSSDRDRARAAYSAGQAAYAAGKYASAEAHFGLADSLVPAVQAKYWRAMSLDQLGNVPGALAAFELVLASPEKAQLGPEKLANAEARQRALASTPGDLVLTTTPSGARVNVSGVDLRAVTPITLKLAPGRHVVRVTLDGYEPQQFELQVTPGAKFTPTLQLVASTNPAATGAMPIPALPVGDAPPPPAPRNIVPGVVTLGIAGAGAIVGTIFGIKALGDKQDFEDVPTTNKADDTERNALIADMAFGVTLTLGITGFVLLVAQDSAPEQPQSSAIRPERVSLAPYVAKTGAGAAARVVF
jgi:hypothetical protein